MEQPEGGNIAGNDYPSFSFGPIGPATSGEQTPYQIVTDASGGPIYGQISYGLHSKRFNYLFHDGHVQALPYTATVGTGTVTAPLGMWTMTPND